VIIRARLASVLDLLLDHFADLVFDLLLIGRTHRVEPILGEAELGEHLDSCIGTRIQSNEHLSSLLLLDRNSPFFRALGRLGNRIALPLREGCR
jgi:hypothetical protein